MCLTFLVRKKGNRDASSLLVGTTLLHATMHGSATGRILIDPGQHHLSNEKRDSGLLGYTGDDYTTQLFNQPAFPAMLLAQPVFSPMLSSPKPQATVPADMTQMDPMQVNSFASWPKLIWGE